VGSRLCVESSEKAKYLGTQFIGIYDRYINGESLSKEKEIPFIISPKTFNTYTDIKTFEDACLATGRTLKSFESEHKGKSDDSYAYEQLKIISEALNGGNHMDYSDTDEYKYYPYFNSVGSSVGFSYVDYHFDAAHSGVGSRLTYKSSEIATYAGKQFLDIYNKYIN
ncbi:hypothetical protein ORI89_19190, partial [Sphingobacterium sp. UT-1RO-CII-1]|uniref:hypothetical protein n=1 Tax=Sphingobacterium sp. UT-1RO-CII-1 TaxID=2995225 RepID=UPI00227AFAD0